ncbi:MAG: CBS domain-containing protein [Candidatus Bathyarchaeota archaeon]|nr:CBS domain-containing protein [Candidatus Bathyarchaeota archaeon]
MLKVRDMMVKNVVTAKGKISVEIAIEMLYKKHVGSIVVTDDEGKCVGIFTERDAIRIMAQKTPLNTPLKKVMTKNIITIREGATFEEARRVITTYGIRHLPVIDQKEKLVGMLAIRSFLDELFGISPLKSS